MNIPKPVHTLAVALAGVAGLELGLNKFLNFGLLKFVPAGILSTVIYLLLGVAGLYVLYALYDKKL